MCSPEGASALTFTFLTVCSTGTIHPDLILCSPGEYWRTDRMHTVLNDDAIMLKRSCQSVTEAGLDTEPQVSWARIMMRELTGWPEFNVTADGLPRLKQRTNHVLVRQSVEVRHVKKERPPRGWGQAAQISIELKGWGAATAVIRSAVGLLSETDTFPQPRGHVLTPFWHGANRPNRWRLC